MAHREDLPPLPHLLRDLQDARRRLRALTDDLDGPRLSVPYLPNLNPPLWELGHVAWFQEWWLLREAGRRPSRLAHADELYDSAAVAHDTRWSLPLLDLGATHRYLDDVLGAVLECGDALDPYFVWLATQHEDMHGEAFLYMRHAQRHPPPPILTPPPPPGGALAGDVQLGGHAFRLGAERDGPVVFDNEKWAHEVFVEPFAIARAPVTQVEYAAFVDAGGYRRREWWDAEGWGWRTRFAAEHPVLWRNDAGGGWLRLHFDRVAPLEPHRPVLGICWHEAQAYCRFAGRRLPTEAEWELAAGGVERRRQPWGEAAPAAPLASVDAIHLDTADVGAFAAGDSAAGCRQMCGNVWEWTASAFTPYPGFERDPYAAYSEPWFHSHRVLRGGSFASRGRTLRNTMRNFYLPWRRDMFCGFRTVAVRG